MNREQLEQLVIEATGRSDKLELIRTSINLAIGEVSSKHLWSALQVENAVVITAESRAVNLGVTSRVTEVRVIDGTLSRPLHVKPKTWLISKCPHPESRSSGRPVYGYLEDDWLYLVPRPDKDYELRYTHFKIHDNLNLPTDTLLIRLAETAVVSYAIYWVFRSIEKFAESAEWFKTYEMQLMSAIKLDKADSVIKQEFEPRTNSDPITWGEYWLDPFVKSMP